MTRVRLKKSPRFDKKFRVTFENGKIVDFGARGYSDYTIHKNPIRMRSYVRDMVGTFHIWYKNKMTLNSFM